MAKIIDAATKEAVVRYYLSDENITQKEAAAKFGLSVSYVGKLISQNVQAGNGIVPDRRAKEPENPWMQYVTPLHKHKQELERRVEHKQAELDKARQELRDFTATLRGLMEDTA